MIKPAKVALDLDVIFGKVSHELEQNESADAPVPVSVPQIHNVQSKVKNYVYRYKVERGAGMYITSASTLDEAKIELLRKYEQILFIEKTSK